MGKKSLCCGSHKKTRRLNPEVKEHPETSKMNSIMTQSHAKAPICIDSAISSRLVSSSAEKSELLQLRQEIKGLKLEILQLKTMLQRHDVTPEGNKETEDSETNNEWKEEEEALRSHIDDDDGKRMDKDNASVDLFLKDVEMSLDREDTQTQTVPLANIEVHQETEPMDNRHKDSETRATNSREAGVAKHRPITSTQPVNDAEDGNNASGVLSKVVTGDRYQDNGNRKKNAETIEIETMEIETIMEQDMSKGNLQSPRVEKARHVQASAAGSKPNDMEENEMMMRGSVVVDETAGTSKSRSQGNGSTPRCCLCNGSEDTNITGGETSSQTNALSCLAPTMDCGHNSSNNNNDMDETQETLPPNTYREGTGGEQQQGETAEKDLMDPDDTVVALNDDDERLPDVAMTECRSKQVDIMEDDQETYDLWNDRNDDKSKNLSPLLATHNSGDSQIQKSKDTTESVCEGSEPIDSENTEPVQQLPHSAETATSEPPVESSQEEWTADEPIIALVDGNDIHTNDDPVTTAVPTCNAGDAVAPNEDDERLPDVPMTECRSKQVDIMEDNQETYDPWNDSNDDKSTILSPPLATRNDGQIQKPKDTTESDCEGSEPIGSENTEPVQHLPHLAETASSEPPVESSQEEWTADEPIIAGGDIHRIGNPNGVDKNLFRTDRNICSRQSPLRDNHHDTISNCLDSNCATSSRNATSRGHGCHSSKDLTGLDGSNEKTDSTLEAGIYDHDDDTIMATTDAHEPPYYRKEADNTADTADSTSIPVNNDDNDEIVMEKTVGDGPHDCRKDKVQSEAEEDIESMEEEQSGRAGFRLQLRPWYPHLIPQRTMTTTSQTQEMDLSTTMNNEEYRRNTIAYPMTTAPSCESNTRRRHSGRTAVRRRSVVNKWRSPKKWRRMIRTKRLQSIFIDESSL